MSEKTNTKTETKKELKRKQRKPKLQELGQAQRFWIVWHTLQLCWLHLLWFCTWFSESIAQTLQMLSTQLANVCPTSSWSGLVSIGHCANAERAGTSATFGGLLLGLLQLFWFSFSIFSLSISKQWGNCFAKLNFKRKGLWMKNLPYIVTAILIVLAGIFALLNRVWAGFVYFVLSLLLLLSLFWGVWLIWQFFTTFKKELAEEFELFRADTINSKQLSAQDFDANVATDKKQFNKKMLKTKLYDDIMKIDWIKDYGNRGE